MAFGQVKNVKSENFPKGDCMIAWDRLTSNYACHTVTSLPKLKREFNNSKLESMEKVPDEWILHPEGLQIQMNKFGKKAYIPDEDFVIHVFNNFPEDYNVILNGPENHLMATGDNVLTICDLQKIESLV